MPIFLKNDVFNISLLVWFRKTIGRLGKVYVVCSFIIMHSSNHNMKKCKLLQSGITYNRDRVDGICLYRMMSTSHQVKVERIGLTYCSLRYIHL